MPNSATLVQALGAAFCAILCALSGMGGGGMMIGARTAAWAKSGGWKNPYVTDGLIAMWDGEWNAGGGVHDPNHLQLDNICGGEPFLLSSGVTISDKALPFNGLTATCTDVSYRPKTIEVCCKINSGRIVLYFVPFDVGEGLFFSFILTTDSSPNIYTGGVNNNMTNFPISKCELGKATTFCGTYDDLSVINSYSNSVKGTLLGRNSWGIRTDGMFIGGRSGGRYEGYGELYSIRFYDRVLEDSEIAANYAIDKVRFNLPDAA